MSHTFTNVRSPPNDLIYNNTGNQAVVNLLGPSDKLLDVGFGSGSNSLLVRKKYPRTLIHGVTDSPVEAKIAEGKYERIWNFDIEGEWPSDFDETYDAIILSHVVEHLRNPAWVISRLLGRLSDGGQVVIAIPNILNWRERVNFIFGRWEYQASGVMDQTHLRFFTYYSAVPFLTSLSPELNLTNKGVTGSFPLAVFRRCLPGYVISKIDQAALHILPNLFGSEVLLKFIKTGR